MANSIFAYIFLGIIVGAAVCFVIFAFKNDFPSEALDILFKAAAGSAVAIFFLVKGVWIDAPTPTTTAVTVAFLHEWQQGRLLPFSAPSVEDTGVDSDRFKGINEIQSVYHYVAFKDLNLRDQVKANSTNDLQRTEPVLANILEFLVLTWLGEQAPRWGFKTEKIYTLTGYGGAGTGTLPPDWTETIKLPPTAENSNPLLDRYPVSISLPSGTKISRKTEGLVKTITIALKHSSIIFSFQPGVGGVFDPRIPAAKAVARRLGITNGNWWEHYFVFKLCKEMRPFTRFSRRAKEEDIWLARLAEEFQKDFSWDLFRTSVLRARRNN